MGVAPIYKVGSRQRPFYTEPARGRGSPLNHVKSNRLTSRSTLRLLVARRVSRLRLRPSCSQSLGISKSRMAQRSGPCRGRLGIIQGPALVILDDLLIYLWCPGSSPPEQSRQHGFACSSACASGALSGQLAARAKSTAWFCLLFGLCTLRVG